MNDLILNACVKMKEMCICEKILSVVGIKITRTRGSQEPVIAHLVFNLTSKVDRKWRCYT